MPAVTADPLTLDRLASLPADARLRPVRSITTAPRAFEGEGFPVRRAFAGIPVEELDPFIMMDQMGEVDYAPGEPRGTDWHPHRGFETVTYVIDGTFLHQDSHGGGGVITDGATQWMTAGGGILHIETPPEDLIVHGGKFHGIQLWVNLPAKDKLVAPRYQNLESGLVKLVTSPDAGALVRIIAGEIDGHRGPGSTYSPITVAHVTLAPGAQVDVPWNAQFNALAYVLAGRGSVGEQAHRIDTGQAAVFGAGDAVRVRADDTSGVDVLLLGGQPIREPVVQYGPFVMNTKAQIIETVEAFQRGELGTVPPNGLRPASEIAARLAR
jgi:redox-sensitive bicupin YhaK (pirin superfamily)